MRKRNIFFGETEGKEIELVQIRELHQLPFFYHVFSVSREPSTSSRGTGGGVERKGEVPGECWMFGETSVWIRRECKLEDVKGPGAECL